MSGGAGWWTCCSGRNRLVLPAARRGGGWQHLIFGRSRGMGHQFQVYLTKDDESGVLSALQAQFGVMIFRPVFYAEEERTVVAFSELGRYPTDVQIALTVPQ